MNIIQGNESNFENLINDGTVLVDFYATWCGPCRMLSPILEEISYETEAKIIKIDVDENRKLAKKYGVMSIPTLIIFKDGNVVDTKVGFMPKEELLNWLNEQ